MGERKHTKRCGRLLDFLQKWYSRTMVEVTLKNKGEDADKDVTYGDDITFQRIIVIEDHKQLIVKKNRPTKMLEIRNISLYTESSQRTAAYEPSQQISHGGWDRKSGSTAWGPEMTLVWTRGRIS